MTMKELVLKNRSYRRFHQNEKVSIETLKELVDLARLSATGGNMQPLKFIVSGDASRNALIFPQLGWAAYLKDWAGPGEGERPSAYIIILGDKRIKTSFGCDHGIVAQSMLLGAAEKGLGGCIIATIQKRQGMYVSCIEEIAYANKWISVSELKNLAAGYKTEYGEYLNFIAESL